MGGSKSSSTSSVATTVTNVNTTDSYNTTKNKNVGLDVTGTGNRLNNSGNVTNKTKTKTKNVFVSGAGSPAAPGEAMTAAVTGSTPAAVLSAAAPLSGYAAPALETGSMGTNWIPWAVGIGAAVLMLLVVFMKGGR